MRKPSWRVRRRIIYVTLLFCASCILWIMIYGADRSVNEVIAMCTYGLATAIIGSYIFGATWDDKNFMSSIRSKEYVDTSRIPTDDTFPPDPHERT